MLYKKNISKKGLLNRRSLHYAPRISCRDL
jgi:hypothetical protein